MNGPKNGHFLARKISSYETQPDNDHSRKKVCLPAVSPRPTWFDELNRGPDHLGLPFGSLPSLLMVKDLLVETEQIKPPVFVMTK